MEKAEVLVWDTVYTLQILARVDKHLSGVSVLWIAHEILFVGSIYAVRRP